MNNHADVIVVGLGAVGSATLYQLARRGVRAIGIDRFRPPHDRGSSHGETRITRCGVGEGSTYVPLAQRSHAIWRELEAATGETLLTQCGFVAIDGAAGATPLHGEAGFLDSTVANARSFGVPHEVLTADEASYRFPRFLLHNDERVYFEPGGGFVYPERCIAAQLAQAAAAGATIRCDEVVEGIMPHASGVELRTDRDTYHADRAIVCAGGWTLGLAGDMLAGVQILRQVLHWFAAEATSDVATAAGPTFIWAHGPTAHDSFYGFPQVAGLTPGVKVAEENYANPLATPEAVERSVAPGESIAMHRRHVAARLAGVSDRAIRATACFYTFAPRGDFIVTPSATSERVTIVSACSGHGFKHSAGLGDSLAARMAG